MACCRGGCFDHAFQHPGRWRPKAKQVIGDVLVVGRIDAAADHPANRPSAAAEPVGVLSEFRSWNRRVHGDT